MSSNDDADDAPPKANSRFGSFKNLFRKKPSGPGPDADADGPGPDADADGPGPDADGPGADAGNKKSSFGMSSISSLMPKIPNLLGNNKSLHDCMMPPTTLKTVPDMDVNTQKYLDIIKGKIDANVIAPYIELGDGLPHLLADGFEQFFKGNDNYKQIMGRNIGGSVTRSMAYVIRSNASKFDGLLRDEPLTQTGGMTCEGKPPFDWRSLIPFYPNTTYAVKPKKEEKPPTSNEEKNMENQAESLEELIMDRFSRKKGASFSEINAYIEQLLMYIYGGYSEIRPHTSQVRKIIDAQINAIIANAVKKYISSNNKQAGGAPPEDGEKPVEDGEDEGADDDGEKPVADGEGEAPPAEVPKKTGFFSNIGNKIKNRTKSALSAVKSKATTLKNKATKEIRDFKNAPISKIKSITKNAFLPKKMLDCETKGESVSEDKPSTYDGAKLMRESDLYTGQKINAVLCQHKDTLKPLCVSIVLHHLSKYLEDVSPGSPLFESTKDAYIFCISTFCEQLPEKVAFQMVLKYLFETEKTGFIQMISLNTFKYEEMLKSYEPFAHIDFKFNSSKSVSSLAPPPNIRRGIESSELKYEFDPKTFNDEGKSVQSISAFLTALSGISLSYGDTRALPRLVFKHLTEIVDVGIKNKETLEKICNLFDETVFRSVDAINNQLVKRANEIPLIMCRYLVSKRSLTTEIIESAIDKYQGTLMFIERAGISPTIMNDMIGFYIYHTLRHKIDPSLRIKDINTIYSDYVAKVINVPFKTWESHPLESVFRRKPDLFNTLMNVVGKPFSTFVSEHRLFGGREKRRKSRRFRKRQKKSTRKHPRRRRMKH
jgi:hypothetical protein